MVIQRSITDNIIKNLLHSNKANIIYGARQTGKTTLAQQIIKQLNLKTISVNADQIKYIDVLSSRNFNEMNSLVHGYDLLFIDEAQRIPEIGINLKILKDNLPKLKIIVTGSSSFDLANKIAEPLTGRSWSYTLFPISFLELSKIYSSFDLKEKIEELMIYGSYPEVFTLISKRKKENLLNEIGTSYLYKDVLELATIKHAGKIRDLLKLLAFQIGFEVSTLELSNKLGISRDAVDRYIDLLEKSFVVFRLSAFSRNLRKEISKMNKIYFYDLGIRNMIIDNFKPAADRSDVGQLWENLLLVERKKILSYKNIHASQYFWRTNTGAELDYVEEVRGKLQGYEFKYSKGKSKVPQTWLQTYNNADFKLINKENAISFVV